MQSYENETALAGDGQEEIEKDVIQYMPPVFAGIRDMQEFAKAVNPELSLFQKRINRAYQDMFLLDMGEDGTARWEKILGIKPAGTDKLDDRRFRIVNRLNSKLPYTLRGLRRKLSQMCGTDGYTIEYDPDTWTLAIKIALTQKKQYSELGKMLRDMIPQNIILDYDLLYNTYAGLQGYTHSVLAGYTHHQLRNDVLGTEGRMVL